jgi:hypothetical protein
VCFGVAVFIWDPSPDASQVKMQGTLDDIDAQIDKQNSILSKFNQTTPDLRQPITELSGNIQKIAGTLDTILTQLPSLATKPTMSLRDEGDLTQINWSAIQTTLARMGYAVGEPDGISGRMTRNAIRAYQRTIRANPNGKLTAEQIASLLGCKS